MSWSNKRKLVLIGMPGSGKTTLGRAVAETLQLPFKDLDDEIAKVAGSSIEEIFEQHGEEKFRQLETEILTKLLKLEEALIIASGGGTPFYNDNLSLIQEKSFSVYINVGLPELIRRLVHTETVRPMLLQSDWKATLAELFKMRKATYEKADVILSGDDLCTEHVIQKLSTGFHTS